MKDLVLRAAALARAPLGIPDLDALYLAQATRTDRPVYWRWLWHLARLSPGGRMLEVGSHEGTACLHWLRGGGAAAVAVDCCVRWKRQRFAGLDFTTVVADSTSATALRAVRGLFDVVLIDTDHTHARTAEEYRVWAPRVRPGGLLVFDDVCYPGYGCSRWWARLTGNKLTLVTLHPVKFGFGVLLC